MAAGRPGHVRDKASANMIRRIANTTIVTALVALAATAAAYALSYAPSPDPRSADLPRMITMKTAAPASGTVTVMAAPTTAPDTSVLPRPAATQPPPSFVGGSSKPSAPRTKPAVKPEDQPDAHEVVTPPVHDSDGEEKPKGDSESH